MLADFNFLLSVSQLPLNIFLMYSLLSIYLDGVDEGGFAKLFVGSVPRTATEEDVSPC